MNKYTSQILDYAQNPPNYGKLNNCKYVLNATNLSCGDNLTIYINEKDGVVTEAKFLDGFKEIIHFLVTSLVLKETIMIEREIINFKTKLSFRRLLHSS